MESGLILKKYFIYLDESRRVIFKVDLTLSPSYFIYGKKSYKTSQYFIFNIEYKLLYIPVVLFLTSRARSELFIGEIGESPVSYGFLEDEILRE